MIRMFAVEDRLLHDPVSGLTHRSVRPLPPGRRLIDDAVAMTSQVVDVARLTNRHMPVSLCWSPLVRCNLHCPQCLDDTTVPEGGRSERARIAAVLSSAQILGVDISGGEPLLLNDLPELAERIRRGGRTVVSLTTNGWHLARMATRLATAVDAIRVSLDGPDRASHDGIRGGGSFFRARDGIAAATGAGVPVQIQTVLMRSNKHRAQQMVELAASLGVCGVTFLQMLPIGSGAGLREEMLTDDDARVVLANLRVPPGLQVRLRARASAAGFTVVRADGRVYRNDLTATHISALRRITRAEDLMLTSRDGSA